VSRHRITRTPDAAFDTALAVARVRRTAKKERAELETRVNALEAGRDTVEVSKLAEIRNYMRRAQGARQYESANTGRWDTDWLTTTDTPYSDIAGSLDKTIARSRRLVDNCGFAESAIKVMVDNVVCDGIRPIPIVRKPNGDANDAVNKDLREAWNVFNDEFDRTRRSTFYECQRLAFRTISISGSVLTNQVPSGKNTLLPIAYQMREPDRLDCQYDTFTKTINYNALEAQTCHGIDLDKWDVPTAYHFKGIEKPISAEFIKIAYRRNRCEQYIGMPWFAPVARRMWDAQNLIQDQAIKSRIAAMIALWFEGDSGGLPPIGPQGSDDSFTWYPGSVGRGQAGSAPKVIQAADSLQDGYLPFIILLLREFASCIGLSYYSIAKDIQGMNFAGTRAVILDERRGHTGAIKWFTKEWCQPHYDDFVKWCVITGQIKNLTIDKYLADPHRFNDCYWVPRPWDWVDPVADVEALIKLKEAGLLADEMYLAPRGIGVREFYEQLSKEKDMREEFKLPEPGAAKLPATAKTAAQLAADEAAAKQPVQQKLQLMFPGA
jgi:lambda family phage portal protein